MRKFTIDQYKRMSSKFNKSGFVEQINILKSNQDILELCSDGNWWGVKTKDKEIQGILEDLEKEFHIELEWGIQEIYCLLEVIGLQTWGLT